MSVKTFLEEIEAVLEKWLPTMITGAEVGATVSGNPELIPIIAGAGGVAEATVAAAESAQSGDLTTAMTSVAAAVTGVKAIIAPPVAQPKSGGGPGDGGEKPK